MSGINSEIEWAILSVLPWDRGVSMPVIRYRSIFWTLKQLKQSLYVIFKKFNGNRFLK